MASTSKLQKSKVYNSILSTDGTKLWQKTEVEKATTLDKQSTQYWMQIQHTHAHIKRDFTDSLTQKCNIYNLAYLFQAACVTILSLLENLNQIQLCHWWDMAKLGQFHVLSFEPASQNTHSYYTPFRKWSHWKIWAKHRTEVPHSKS